MQRLHNVAVSIKSKQVVLYNASVLVEVINPLMMSYIDVPCILLFTLSQHEVLQWSRDWLLPRMT